jgi:hypothetical protein
LAGNYPPIVKAAANLAGPIAKQRHTGLSWDELAGTVARTDLEMAKAALTRLGARGAEPRFGRRVYPSACRQQLAGDPVDRA